MQLSEVVASAVRERVADLEQLVREQVDAELARLVPEVVERELAARRNGHADGEAPASDAQSLRVHGTRTQRCASCGETKPLDAFAHRTDPAGKRDGLRKGVCRDCENQRRRDSRTRTPPRRRGVMMRGGVMRSPDAIVEARDVLASAVDAGVVERDGRAYRLLRLPDVVRVAERSAIALRRPRHDVVAVA